MTSIITLKAYVKNKFSGEFEILEDDFNEDKKILIKHSKCGESYYRSEDSARAGGCKICGKKSHKEKTTRSFAEVLRIIKEHYGENVDVSGEYINGESIIHVKFLECGHEYDVKTSDFTRGYNCRICRNIAKKSHEDFINTLNEKYPEKYIILNEYKNAKTKVSVKYVDCGCIKETDPYCLLVGTGCHKHGDKEKMEMWHSLFVNKVNKKYPNTFDIKSDCRANKNSIVVTHLLCGNTYETTRLKLVHDGTCPYCNSSLGETRITEYLENNKIEYIKEYKIKECKHVGTLRFDFMIKNNKHEISLIEFQGRQHYEPSFKFNGMSDESALLFFESIQKRDAIKKEFCLKNNIKLLCIHYKDIYKINNILDQFIKDVSDEGKEDECVL